MQVSRAIGTLFNICQLKLEKIPIATTGVLFPLVLPSGVKIQSELGNQLGFIYSIVPIKDVSYIIIATIKKKKTNTHEAYLNSIHEILKDPSYFINYLLTYFIFNNDNVVIHPDWFSSTSLKIKNQLIKLINFNIGNSGETFLSLNPINFFDELKFSIKNYKLIIT